MKFMKNERAYVQRCAEKVLSGQEVTKAEALALIKLSLALTPLLVAYADQIRSKFKGTEVVLCGIVNARSGRCSEDCTFCAQSAHYSTSAPVYPLKSEKELVRAATTAQKAGSNCFSIVTSGKNAGVKNEFPKLARAIALLRSKTHIRRCASLGSLTLEQARQLKKAGLQRFHHNLETAESFFKRICTTHTYAERSKTVQNAKDAGMEVCSGGIIGLGETPHQRVELACTLRDLKVDSVPINILSPIPGTPAAKIKKRITPLEVLRTIAVFRYLLPKQDIIICGGRDVNLRELHSFVFWAGANGVLTGDYLTTKGRRPEQDLQLVEDLGLTPF
jgi:biotin synthase